MKKISVLLIVLSFALMSCTNSVSSNEVTTPSAMDSDAQLTKIITGGLDNEILSIELTDEIAEGLKFMREEEKLARDIYINSNELYSLRVFNNISRSEQIHMNAILYLLGRYEIEDPVVDDAVGEFQNTELAELYNQLKDQSSLSVNDALMVGAAIEEIDIIDLKTRIAKVDNTENCDIYLVYNNLKRASGFHLKAFVWNLKIRGIEYTPQYLDQQTYDDIVK